MSEIILRAQNSAAVIADASIEPWRRAWQALEALSGLSLLDLSDSAKDVVETELVNVNRILAGYDLQTSDDYVKIDDVDLAEILAHTQAATEALIDFELDRVMTGLRTKSNKLPKAEIEEVRTHKTLFVPLLMEELEQAVALARDGEDPDGAHFFAAFLLTELEVDAAFPIMLEGFKMRGERDFDLFGDAVHELLPSALALFSRGNTDRIDDVLQDSSIDMYVRWSATNAYRLLVRDGGITREAAVAKLHDQLKRCIAEKDYEMAAPVVCSLSDLAASEALETIKEAYDHDLVDEFIINRDFAESQIADGEQTLQATLARCRPTGMPDTIAELSHWAAFREEPTRKASVKPPVAVTTPTSPLPTPSPTQPVETIRSERVRVGRNDPCPCGSGKKFKKCCKS